MDQFTSSSRLRSPSPHRPQHHQQLLGLHAVTLHHVHDLHPGIAIRSHMWVSIFMASSESSVLPAFTRWPTTTATLTIAPGMGAAICQGLPGSASGRAPSAAAALARAADADHVPNPSAPMRLSQHKRFCYAFLR